MTSGPLVTDLRGWRDELTRRLRRRVAEPADAEDLAQEALLRWAVASSSAVPPHPRAWLFAVARNLAIDHHRRRGRRDDVVLDGIDVDRLAQDDAEPEDPESSQTEALAHCVVPLLRSLGAADADLLHRVELDGKSIRGYAERRSLGYAAAKSRTRRARARLAELVRACRDEWVIEARGPFVARRAGGGRGPLHDPDDTRELSCCRPGSCARCTYVDDHRESSSIVGPSGW